jgi:alanyl-tRNA synthetase
VRKSQEEVRRADKGREELLVELAELMASRLLAEAQAIAGRKVIVRNFADRDAGFVKLLAQKATRLAPKVVALVASEIVPASVVFASSPGLDCDMGATLKKALTRVGGRGGGSKEFAQGGVPAGTNISDLLNQAAKDLGVE